MKYIMPNVARALPCKAPLFQTVDAAVGGVSPPVDNYHSPPRHRRPTLGNEYKKNR